MKRQVTLCVLVFALLLTCANAMAAKISNATAENGSGATVSDKDEEGKSFDGKALMVTCDGQKNKEYVVMVLPSDVGVPTTETINSAQDGLSVMAYMNQTNCTDSSAQPKVTFTVRPDLSKAQNGQEFSVYITSDETSGSAAKKVASFTAEASLLGDVNDKDGVTVADAIYILKYLANKPGYDLTGMDDVADVNRKDGITVADAIYILKYLANKPGYTL